MTAGPAELVIRPITGPAELDLFCQLTYTLDHELLDDLEQGRRKPEWMWVALRGDRVVARAAWWGDAAQAQPELLDVLDLDDDADDRVEVGTSLLRTALATILPTGATPPEYGRYVPSDWRTDPTSRRVVEGRVAVVEQCGAVPLVERLRLEWRPGTPIAEPTGRLTFRQARGRAEMIELMTAAIAGTLDAHSRQDALSMPAADAAAAHFDGDLAQQVSPQEWWQVALLRDGRPVGFVAPGRNHYHPVISYVAVLPEHRGNGYIDEILAEGTRVLASQGVPLIRAATDLGNAPMARAFERAGWVNFERAINLTWAPGISAAASTS